MSQNDLVLSHSAGVLRREQSRSKLDNRPVGNSWPIANGPIRLGWKATVQAAKKNGCADSPGRRGGNGGRGGGEKGRRLTAGDFDRKRGDQTESDWKEGMDQFAQDCTDHKIPSAHCICASARTRIDLTAAVLIYAGHIFGHSEISA